MTDGGFALESSDLLTPSKESAKARGVRERWQLSDRLKSEGAFDLSSKLDACGTPFGLTRTCCGSVHMAEVQCRRRWCPACSWHVQQDRMARFEKACQLMKWPLFVTLTMKNTDDHECIRTIRAHWSKMRRRKLMVDNIKGGVSTIEITNTGEGWHPHLHILCDCEWLALHVPKPRRADSEGVKRQKYDHARLELSALWASILNQEHAIVSALRKKPGDVLAYTMKYAVKGSDLIASPDPVAPLIRVLSRSRMVSAFGNMHGRVAADEEEEKAVVCCPECGCEQHFVLTQYVEKMLETHYNKTHLTGSFSTSKILPLPVSSYPSTRYSS